jgi:exodeoxyribonuclease VII large subunit
LAQQIPILSVTEFTGMLKSHVEDAFPLIAVRGEISNLSQSANGHVFLTLKDSKSQLRAVLWRDTARQLKFKLKDGLEVVAVGGLDLYPARGTYQLVVQELVPEGIGALELAFRQLREQLAAEGLFAAERKRPLPRIPNRIALVTSPQGAAVKDMLQIILRRWPAANIVIVPVPVQGDGAVDKIAMGIRLLPRLEGVDVAIVGRGGGSLEDLWPFNEEVVARAIAACPVPIISAVGHEIDVSISDLVADRRALTPSESGEIVVPDSNELLADLEHLERRLQRIVTSRIENSRNRLDSLAARPVLADPWQQLERSRTKIDDLFGRLSRSADSRLVRARSRLAELTSTLDALSPLQVLSRGYSITQDAQSGVVIQDAEALTLGTLIETRLHAGRVISRVEQVLPATPQ